MVLYGKYVRITIYANYFIDLSINTRLYMRGAESDRKRAQQQVMIAASQSKNRRQDGGYANRDPPRELSAH